MMSNMIRCYQNKKVIFCKPAIWMTINEFGISRMWFLKNFSSTSYVVDANNIIITIGKVLTSTNYPISYEWFISFLLFYPSTILDSEVGKGVKVPQMTFLLSFLFFIKYSVHFYSIWKSEWIFKNQYKLGLKIMAQGYGSHVLHLWGTKWPFWASFNTGLPATNQNPNKRALKIRVYMRERQSMEARVLIASPISWEKERGGQSWNQV